MAIDTAQDRRAVAGVPMAPFLGVTPDSAKDGAWRQESGYSYSGIAAIALSLNPTIRFAPELVTQRIAADRTTQRLTAERITRKFAADDVDLAVARPIRD